jgi:glucose uptake protein GlcU
MRILIMALGGFTFALIIYTAKYPILTIPCLVILLMSFSYWVYDLKKEIRRMKS